MDLVGSNQRKYFENATQRSKRMCKRRVATRQNRRSFLQQVNPIHLNKEERERFLIPLQVDDSSFWRFLEEDFFVRQLVDEEELSSISSSSWNGETFVNDVTRSHRCLGTRNFKLSWLSDTFCNTKDQCIENRCFILSELSVSFQKQATYTM